MEPAYLDTFNTGIFNRIVFGYLIQAMRYAGFDAGDINKAVYSLCRAFDDTTAQEAENIADEF